jgi:3-(3-hydroxy-phenyl)propionate hydroxylase
MLNLPDQSGRFAPASRPGLPAPEAKIQIRSGEQHLSQLFGKQFIALRFMANGDEMNPDASDNNGAGLVRLLEVRDTHRPEVNAVFDELGQMRERYDATAGTLYLVRPDGYVLGRWRDGRDVDINGVVHAMLLSTLHSSSTNDPATQSTRTA